MDDYSFLFKNLSNNELYKFCVKYIIRQSLGYFVNQSKFNSLINVANSKDKRIFEYAEKDANTILSILVLKMEEAKVINIKRIDFLNSEELNLLILSIGAANQHPNFNTDSNKITVSDIFGIEGQNILVCKVAGDSMIGANIYNGDTLIVDTSSEAKNEDIVVVNLNDQTLVKRLILKPKSTYLHSENNTIKPYKVKNDDNLAILGVVKHILHSL